jgi:membrane protein YdbS with pleckstrin-like domain
LPEPARTLSPRARWVWGLRQAGGWAALLAAALLWGGRLAGWLWLVPLAGLLTVPLAVPWLRWRRWRWDVRDEGIDIRHGTLTERRTLVPWIRVQHVDTRRGVVEQALELSTVVVHTAAGGHEIPLLGEGEAELLRERIGALARTEDA